MNYQDILERRGAGTLRFCELFRPSDLTNEDALKKFDLKGSWGDLTEVSRKTAQDILTLFLWKDAAYQTELMPFKQATTYMRSLPIWMPQFRYFTNGGWISHFDGAASWLAMTDATFDGGIIALSEHIVACYWFEDED